MRVKPRYVEFPASLLEEAFRVQISMDTILGGMDKIPLGRLPNQLPVRTSGQNWISARLFCVANPILQYWLSSLRVEAKCLGMAFLISSQKEQFKKSDGLRQNEDEVIEPLFILAAVLDPLFWCHVVVAQDVQQTFPSTNFSVDMNLSAFAEIGATQCFLKLCMGCIAMPLCRIRCRSK